MPGGQQAAAVDSPGRPLLDPLADLPWWTGPQDDGDIDEFDLDLRLGELDRLGAGHGQHWQFPLGAQSDPQACLPTGGAGAGGTCNTADQTCAGTCAGLNSCPQTQCGGTCPNTCANTCGNTCPNTCAHTCGNTCANTCRETCHATCNCTELNTHCNTCGNTCHHVQGCQSPN